MAAKRKIGSKQARLSNADNLRALRRVLKRAVKEAKRGDCAGAKAAMSRVYARTQYPAVHKTRTLAEQAYARAAQAIVRVCAY